MRAVINFQLYRDNKTIPVQYYFENPVRVDKIYTQSDMEKALNYAERCGQYVVTAITYEAAKLFDPLLKVHEVKGPIAIFYYFEEFTSIPDTHSEVLAERFKFQQSKDEIIEAVETIQQYIRQGITYQVNYTTRLKRSFKEDPFAVYQHLSKSHGKYTAYIEDEDHVTISISPELFFQYDLHKQQLLTKPMKGTIKRGQNIAEDKSNYETLKHSDKDKAENVMIVDLLRNDLSRIAKKGSVKVDRLFDIERYETVFQMTSTITAINNQHSLFEIFAALFPCGSITGAPKQSTMEIIHELESARGIYCGTIGLIKPEDYMIFNIPIRTISLHNNEAVYSAGGGITIDSNPQAEYEEIIAKTQVVQPQFDLIETMRVTDGVIQREKYHMERLRRGIEAFNINIDIDSVSSYIRNHKPVNGKYRVTLSIDGNLNATTEPLPSSKVYTAELLPSMRGDDRFYQHKTTVRTHYTESNQELALYYDTHLLEFNIGNLVYRIDDHYFTPSAQRYILEGCMKQQLLDEGIISEQDITIEEFLEMYASGRLAVYMINSLREWSEVKIIL